MNLSFMKYAVEVARTMSISRAAENLYMSQPNLSRAIKELEAELGIEIFSRSTRGITVTRDGEAFLRDAARIVVEVERVEALYRGGKSGRQFLRAALCSGVYISRALVEFTGSLEPESGAYIGLVSADSGRCIDMVCAGEATLGVVRFPTKHLKKFESYFDDRCLRFKSICEFESVLAAPEGGALAQKEIVRREDLKGMCELRYNETLVPYAPPVESRRCEWNPEDGIMILMPDWERCFAASASREDSYVWSEPVPGGYLSQRGLCRVEYEGERGSYTDALVFRDASSLGELGERFESLLVKNARALAL